MTHLSGSERAAYVQDMFGRIAGRYNLMNRLMTFGQDLKWRRFVVQQAHLKAGDKLLDLATGTGDIAFQALKFVPGLKQVVGGDFSLPMMRVGMHLPQVSPEADRRTFIRRLKFDLLGLPPTPEEVEAFVTDKSADAYEKLVDKYLASPQFGERWARHWLDVVRFAESHGFEMNQPRPTAYHYRDYVIQAFNDDKPYDQFVREQLAGDTLGADAATGFLVAGPWDQVKSPDAVLTANQRADELHDMIGTTGSAFLGLTVGARCHTTSLTRFRRSIITAQPCSPRASRRTGLEAGRPRQGTRDGKRIGRVSESRAMEPLADPKAKSSPDAGEPADERRAVRAGERGAVHRGRDEPGGRVSTRSSCSRGRARSTPRPRNCVLPATTRTPGHHKLEHLNDGKFGNSRS